MNTTDKYLTYRGNLRALAVVGKSLVFVGVHPEQHPTAVYRLDVEKMEISAVGLPCGGLSLASDGSTLWAGGDDRKLYQVAAKAKSAQALKVDLGDGRATHLALLSSDRLAALCGERILIVDRAKGTELQSLDLPEKGTALAADPTGEWLVVGTSKGNVLVFDCEEKDSFQIGETAKLHEGAVTALLFEPEELRFLSAGADQKLLLTHARGKLEPEDRGRGASHKDHVTAIVHVPGERFITGGRDKTCKTWARGGATRPATLEDGVPAVVDLAVIEIHDRPHLAVAGSDNSIRFFLLDAAGRFGAATHRLYDAYDRAKHLLGENDAARRGEALHALAEYNDQRSVEMIAQQIGSDNDHALRLRGTELLAGSQHPRAARLLEPLLKHNDGAVRLAALAGLRKLAGTDDLRPLELALDAEKADVGTAAVKGLEPLAKQDDQARQLLIGTLDRRPAEVRRAALLSLENVFPKNSAEPTLIAAVSQKPNTRRLAVIRCYQRKLLDQPRVVAALRRCGEDSDADVRRTAFLVSLLSRDKLAAAVRERDKELHRQLFELETFEVEPTKGAKAKEPPKVKPSNFNLAGADYQPLLSAMSSRVMDTCLLGARCLALLGDARAFGLLLQLSREEDTKARVQVCQSLAAMADPRALQRLETLIDDPAPEVRDAAYTALSAIRSDAPLAAAAAGLGSLHADIRRRGLQTLVAAVRKAKAKTASDEATSLLLLALNDSDNGVRSEAFKSSLNLEVAGDKVATLRFVLSSVHASVRREVLTEAMAQDGDDWAWQLLLDLFDDPDEQIRADAYEHAIAKTKRRDAAPMQVALRSRFVDTRKRAVESLVKLKTDAAQQALVAAIEDDDADVRGTALKALIAAEAVDELHKAMQSRHADVRLQAACARAFYSDAAALEPLLAAATAPKPERKADQETWQRHMLIGLYGLGVLADPECTPKLLPLLNHEVAEIRQHAANALVWCARPQHAESLKEALQHADLAVRYRVALALTLCHEPAAAPVVFSSDAAKLLDEKQLLIATAAYGAQSETRLAALLDSETPWIRNAAFLVLLLRDWRTHNGTPERLLTALAARQPRIRLAAARGLEVFNAPPSLADYIVQFVNYRGDEQPWSTSPEQVGTLANLLVFGSPHCQAQTIALLESLAAEKEDDWKFAWRLHTLRYADEIESADAAAGKTKLSKVSTPATELAQLAFGTYVGLVREQGSYHQRRERPSFDAPVNAIRQAAIRRLAELAIADKVVLEATLPVLVQALSDPLTEVRTLAFERLADLGMDAATRAAAAIESGRDDLAVAGLKLLTEQAGAKGQAILEDVITSRTDNLSNEAARLLIDLVGPVKAADSMLESPNPATRSFCVARLRGELDAGAARQTAAQKRLHAVLESRYEDVRRQTAITLAEAKDVAAFDTLAKLLPATSDRGDQLRLIQAVTQLGDPRGPDLLLDRLLNDPEKTAEVDALFEAVGQFRNPANAPRLLEQLERGKWRISAAQALFRISGYDQPIYDPEDKLPDREWMKEQHPRHDQVLAGLLERSLELGWHNQFPGWIPHARWSLSNAVDSVLATLGVHPDERVRQMTVEAIGWRLKHRQGPAEPLVAALEHRDPVTKFLAAEGLAKAGRKEGINVLLSAVELMSDLSLRQRAVLALGELADERALEVLLKLANDEVHALRDVAAEAIGHLGQSEKAEQILELLTRLAKSDQSCASRAIVGLRWLNVPDGWKVVREHASGDSFLSRVAVEQLGYNDDHATRDLLLKLAAWNDDPLTELTALRRLLGDESLEPDYAVLGGECFYDPAMDSEYRCLQRVCERGDPSRIFKLLPKCGECFEVLSFHLLQLEPRPEDAAAEALSSVHAATVQVAAGVLGRTGSSKHGKAVATAIGTWAEHWNEKYQAQRKGLDEDPAAEQAALIRLTWAAGRVGAAKAELLQLVASHTDEPRFNPVRIAALAALGEQKLAKGDLARLAAALEDPDFRVRRGAAELLVALDPATAGKQAEQLLSDRQTFNELAASDQVKTTAALTQGAAHPHYQPIVLPHLVAGHDVKTLAGVSQDGGLSDNTRLGALEGLARMAIPEAEQQLSKVGNDQGTDEELRKAAWRALRRSKRLRAKVKQ